jgi:glycosyltransferase involved in cell wall biosynthesis
MRNPSRVEQLLFRPARAGDEPREVDYVANSVDTQAFRRETPDNSLKASLRLGSDVVIGFVGELREKKGQRFLLPAFAELARRRDARLLLIGGVRRDAQEAFSKFQQSAPGAAQRIELISYDRSAKRLCQLLSLCDLLVFPSLYEGQPNAVLEAMAAERLVLATAVGGHLDLLEHGVTGGLLPLADLDRLPDAMLEMLDLKPEEQARMMQAARAHVLEHHSPTLESRAYGELYAACRSSR